MKDACPKVFSERTGGYVRLTPKYVPLDHPNYDVLVPREARGMTNYYCAHPAQCPEGWSLRYSESESCYLYQSNAVTWTAARDSCVQLGGYLAAIQTPEEMTSVREYLTSASVNHFVWTGLNDRDSEGTFTWIGFSGALPLSSSLWSPGEPNDSYNREDCVVTDGNNFYDASCDRSFSYLCELNL
ncbi:lactose-binding lectin l-2-like [Diadema setosum]|uniref:lactose-binding lectin l-2-like n=1 Tax=Diadema setosum TaxID=31175 RepID=UPI003B3B3195